MTVQIKLEFSTAYPGLRTTFRDKFLPVLLI